MQAEHQPNVDEVGREAIAAFFDAATGRDVVFSAAKGLRKTLELADHEDIAQLKLDTINEISNYVFAATRKVADHVGDKIGEGRVYLGMSAATGLLSLFGKSSEELRISTSFDLLMDRFDHVTLLAAELASMKNSQRSLRPSISTSISLCN